MTTGLGPAGGAPLARRPRAGITLIELMVLIAIIALLLGLLLPALQTRCRYSRPMQCSSQLRQIGLAVAQYANAHQQYPAGRPSRLIAGDDSSFGPSVFVSVLPFMDGVDLYNGYNFSVPPTAAANLTISQVRPGTLHCPSDWDPSGLGESGPGQGSANPGASGARPPSALTSYGFLYGTVAYAWEARADPSFDPLGQVNGSFNDRQVIKPADFTDGLSHTVLASERALSYINRGRAIPVGRWASSLGASTLLFGTEPPNAALNYPAGDNGQLATRLASVSSLHPGGVKVLMGDGSVRFVKETIGSWPVDPASARPVGAVDVGDGLGKLPVPGVWQALITRAGGEAVLPTSKDGDFDQP